MTYSWFTRSQVGPDLYYFSSLHREFLAKESQTYLKVNLSNRRQPCKNLNVMYSRTSPWALLIFMFILLPCRRVTRMPELPWGQPPFLSKFPYKTWQTIYIRNKTLARLEAKSFSWPDKRLSLQPSKVNSVKTRQSEHAGALSALHSGEGVNLSFKIDSDGRGG